MNRRSKIVALALAVPLFLTGCAGITPPTEAETAEVVETVAPEQEFENLAPEVVSMEGADGGVSAQTGQNVNITHVWDQDGCYADSAMVNGAFVAGRRSNLCRAVDTRTQGFYYLYPRSAGQNSDWYLWFGEMYGYTYWKYPNTTWFRSPMTGGQAEIEVQDANGNLFYMDYVTWMNESPESLAISQGYDLEHVEKQGLISAAQTSTYVDVATTNTDIDPSMARAEIAQTQSGQGMTLEELEIWNLQWNNRLGSIWTQPSCNFSSNGCF